MFSLLQKLLPGKSAQEKAPVTAALRPTPTDEIALDGSILHFKDHLSSGPFPIPDWNAVMQWASSFPEARQPVAWDLCERAWLAHLLPALGPQYTLRESGNVLLASALNERAAGLTLDFTTRSLQRIVRILDGVAAVPEWGKDIVLVFDSDEAYYQYVAHYYPEGGEFAVSSGMYINAGCGHFVTMQSDLRMLEPVIAHELTHSCLSHLPIPAWLNEGLAVNTEQRLCPPGTPLFTPVQMHAKHLRFWNDSTIQEFWSGRSFLRTDDGNLLSYDLARILVAQLSAEWAHFRSFAINAQLADGGAAACLTHFNSQLGELVAALLESDAGARWNPTPERWQEAPVEGAF